MSRGFFFAEADEVDACDDKADADPLMYCQANKNFGCAAYKFDREAGDGNKDEIEAKDHAGFQAVAKGPKDAEDADHLNHFVNGCWVYVVEGGDEAVGIGFAPGQFGGDAITAVAGELAATAAKEIPNDKARRNGIDCRPVEGVVSAQGEENGCCSAEEPTEPGEARSGKDGAYRIVEKYVRIFEDVEYFAADNATYHGCKKNAVGQGDVEVAMAQFASEYQ